MHFTKDELHMFVDDEESFSLYRFPRTLFPYDDNLHPATKFTSEPGSVSTTARGEQQVDEAVLEALYMPCLTTVTAITEEVMESDDIKLSVSFLQYRREEEDPKRWSVEFPDNIRKEEGTQRTFYLLRFDHQTPSDSLLDELCFPPGTSLDGIELNFDESRGQLLYVTVGIQCERYSLILLVTFRHGGTVQKEFQALVPWVKDLKD
ncbi:hypothetical protein C8J56DRAFT_1040393 [Mycena floridula]|nr:hypothetical protein C8J56DRAFT_1040393 [Mycena floridula]